MITCNFPCWFPGVPGSICQHSSKCSAIVATEAVSCGLCCICTVWQHPLYAQHNHVQTPCCSCTAPLHVHCVALTTCMPHSTCAMPLLCSSVVFTCSPAHLQATLRKDHNWDLKLPTSFCINFAMLEASKQSQVLIM